MADRRSTRHSHGGAVQSSMLMRLMTLSCLLILLGGCAHRGPEAELLNLSLGETNEVATVVNFDVRLHNPNAEPLALQEFRYDVYLGSRLVYRGRRSAEASLHTEADGMLRLPAVIPRADWSPDDPEPVTMRVDGRLWYLPPGRIPQTLFDAGIFRPASRYRLSGEWPGE